MDYETGAEKKQDAAISLTLKMRPERRLIRSTGSNRCIDFHIQVEDTPGKAQQQRPALKLALVLDRSGSMSGEKIQTAKSATLAVIDQLTARDKVTVVIFDNHIDVVQKLASVTAELKSQLRETVQAIQARSSTALHEGWLTGCNTIASEALPSDTGTISRCFLLTDGLANVGVTDPERIASEAAGVREHTGISTSTFGIGSDYSELLLGPMAVAGGGQFHHLRTANEITTTFIGELGALLAVAASQVCLEFEVESKVDTELISAYWKNSSLNNALQHSIAIGDLQKGEERHVIVRFHFPEQDVSSEQQIVRARIVWVDDESERSTAWQELHFSYASQNACDDESRDSDVVHQVGLQEADRARREAISKNKLGDFHGAQISLATAKSAIARYAQDDQILQAEIQELDAMHVQMAAPMAPAVSKEIYYQQQNRSRGQRDYRSTQPEANKTTGVDKKAGSDKEARRKLVQE